MTSSPPPFTTTRTGRLMLIMAWILVLIGLTWFFSKRLEHEYNPNQNLSEHIPGQPREVVLYSNRQHHYVASGFINGHPVTFLLDTGASDVVVPADLAEQLGLKRRGRYYAQTANGVVAVYGTTLSQLRLGSISLQDVPASINPAMENQAVLLGMTALSQLEFSQSQGQLTIRQLSQ